MKGHLMSPNSTKPWFGPKRIGWGISPKTWQGYVVTILGALILGLAFAGIVALFS